MVVQAKIDLAVLLKLFQHSEQGGEAETPREVAHLFSTNVSMRRIELALQTLESRGEVQREYHPHYTDEGLWQISLEGLRTVEKALRLPNSFIARLNAGGDDWLQSDEAQNAELTKNLRYDDLPINRPPFPAPMSTSEPQTVASKFVTELITHSSINWTKWGTIIGAVGIVVTILLAVF